jgi:hypothetical protein
MLHARGPNFHAGQRLERVEETWATTRKAPAGPSAPMAQPLLERSGGCQRVQPGHLTQTAIGNSATAVDPVARPSDQIGQRHQTVAGRFERSADGAGRLHSIWAIAMHADTVDGGGQALTVDSDDASCGQHAL